jgi:hypothetical protein
MANTKIPSELSSTPSISDSGDATAITIDSSENVAVTGNLSAAKLTSNNGVLELDDNGSHNGIINSPASLRINIDSDNGATGESFTVGHNQTAINTSNELFKVLDSGTVVVGGDATANGDLTISNGGAEQLEIFAGNTTNVNATQHYNRSTSNYVDNKLIANNHIFASGATEIARITGTGLTFNGDTAAANALDDYEEGTFTATLQNTGTNPAPTATGYYVKLGRIVFYNVYFAAITITSGGETRWTGLPYSASNSGNNYSVGLYQHGTVIVNDGGKGHGYVGGTTFYAIGHNSTGYASYSNGNTKYGMWTGHYLI